jgi:hypothetical protein
MANAALLRRMFREANDAAPNPATVRLNAHVDRWGQAD